jgi:ferredoxin-type protein NapG
MTFSRREFFTQLSRTLTSNVVSAYEAVGRSATIMAEQEEKEEPSQKWLRPPGALKEKEFLSACTQCTDCQTACPYDSIRRLGPEFGINAGTPAIIPDESPCYLCEDMPCITACEPRALRTIDRREVSMGLAVLKTDTCYVAQGQPCDYCFVRCPLKDTAIKATNKGLPIVIESGCVGCGVCAYLCPADAILINPF